MLLTRKRLMLGISLIASLALPGAASAEIPPDRSLTMSSAAATVAWDGPAAVGSYSPAPGTYSIEKCSKEKGNYCDLTLLNVRSGAPVTLEVTIGDYSVPAADFDLRVYKSNAAGTTTSDDELLPESGPTDAPTTGLPSGFEEHITLEGLSPGYYLVSVSYYETTPAGSSYHGEATVTGATPVAEDPPPSGGGGGGGGGSEPPPSQPSPSPQPAPAPAPGPAPSSTLTTLPFKAAATVGSAKKAKKKRSLAFKATADQDISSLVVQLLQGKPGSKQKVIGTFKAASFAKGSRTIKLKLSKKVAKKLKKGKYTLAARGSVNGQALQALQAVTIKK